MGFSKCLSCSFVLKVLQRGTITSYLRHGKAYTLHGTNILEHLTEQQGINSYRVHGDTVYDPRSDLSQGGGDDAEHPMVISMYTVIAARVPSKKWQSADILDSIFHFSCILLLLYKSKSSWAYHIAINKSNDPAYKYQAHILSRHRTLKLCVCGMNCYQEATYNCST